MPRITRPPEKRSSVASSLAVSSGLRSGTSSTPVATIRRVVAAAAIAIATNGSQMW
jgi:hypothetical protein